MSQVLRSLWARWRSRPAARTPYRPQLEGLETRALPSINLPTSGTFGPGQVGGTSSNDQFVLRLLAGNDNFLQVSDNGGVSFNTVALASLSSLTVTGFGGNDSLLIDNSNGLVGKPGDLDINFVAGPGHDLIGITGDTGTLVNETYAVGDTVDSGVLAANAVTTGSFVLNFTGVAAVYDSLTADTLDVQFNDNGHYITLGQGAAFNGLATLQIAGIDYQGNNALVDAAFPGTLGPDPQTPATVGYVPITLANKTAVTVEAGGGNDLILLNAPGAVTGLAHLVVDGGLGTDRMLGDQVPAGADLHIFQMDQAIAAATDSIYANNLYANLLKRLPTDGDVSYWTSVEHSSGLAAVVKGIGESGEARFDLVGEWYAAYLNRPADPAGQGYWAWLLTHGTSEEQALSGILGSAEFQTVANSMFSSGTNDQRFVKALYQDLLNRTPSTAEVNYWVGYKSSQGAAKTALAFLTSTELRRNFINAVYQTYLDVPADTTAYNTWLTSSFTFTSVREGVLSSLTYFDPRKAAATSIAFTPVTLKATLQGQSTDTSDPQFYSFIVGKQHLLALTVQPTGSVSAVVTLEDDVGTVMASTNPGGGVNKFSALVKPGRTYYLRVVSSTNDTAGFVVNLALL